MVTSGLISLVNHRFTPTCRSKFDACWRSENIIFTIFLFFLFLMKETYKRSVTNNGIWRATRRTQVPCPARPPETPRRRPLRCCLPTTRRWPRVYSSPLRSTSSFQKGPRLEWPWKYVRTIYRIYFPTTDLPWAVTYIRTQEIKHNVRLQWYIP